MNIKKTGYFLGPLTAFVIWLFTDLDPANKNVTLMAGITAWITIWWLTEAVYLSVTALIPQVLIPLLGIADVRLIASQYMDSIIFLFIGGFIVAFAIEKWGLHNYFAHAVLSKIGTTPPKILIGVMATAYFISMWVSNTATVLMLIAMVIAILKKIKTIDDDKSDVKKIATALLIGLAYSASIGGMTTLVGTPTNMIFYKEFMKTYSQNYELNFFIWFKWALPVSITLLLAAFGILYMLFIHKLKHKEIVFEPFALSKKMNYEQKIIAIIFGVTAVLWFTRSTIDFGFFKLTGWSTLFKMPAYIDDSVVAIVMAILLFLIPASDKTTHLIEWEDAAKLPFDIILLFGGGFALAKGFEISGLSTWIASHLGGLTQSGLLIFIVGVCVLMCVISEFASNVACIQLMLPILNAIILQLDVNPMVILVPATMAASLGFMLPVATAPNTIIYGTKQIKTTDMFKAGLLVDIAGILLISVLAYSMI